MPKDKRLPGKKTTLIKVGSKWKCPVCEFSHAFPQVVGTHYHREHVPGWNEAVQMRIRRTKAGLQGRPRGRPRGSVKLMPVVTSINNNKPAEEAQIAKFEEITVRITEQLEAKYHLQTIAALVGGQIIQLIRDTARATDCRSWELATAVLPILGHEASR